MINKGFILKTAAVASCVVVLGITGCQGGVEEAAAVKNKGTVSIEIHEAKGEEIDVISKGDREETVETVDRSDGHEGTDASPQHTNKQDMGDGERPTGYDTQDRDNDTERDKGESRREQEVKNEAEPSEDGDSVLTEEDRSDVGGDTGTAEYTDEYSGEEGWSADTSAVYSVSDMGCGEGRESDMGDGEYTDDADEWYEPDTAGVEAEEGFTDEYSDSGVDESGYSDGAGDNLIYLGLWQSTGYCPNSCCCGEWASGYTASGTLATEGVTCACGMFDFGTVLYIEGYGYRVVEDRGVEGEFVDIFYSTHEQASAHGLQYVNVYLVN